MSANSEKKDSILSIFVVQLLWVPHSKKNIKNNYTLNSEMYLNSAMGLNSAKVYLESSIIKFENSDIDLFNLRQIFAKFKYISEFKV